jgi:L-alanine-DL-glutamate epimerase-like enolase superfamily enzyme
MVVYVDCFQIDVTRCGGITEFQRAAAAAAGAGQSVSTHTAPHPYLPVALATLNLRNAEWFHDHVRIECMLFEGARTAKGGQLSPDLSATGNGLTFKREPAQRWRVA